MPQRISSIAQRFKPEIHYVIVKSFNHHTRFACLSSICWRVQISFTESEKIFVLKHVMVNWKSIKRLFQIYLDIIQKCSIEAWQVRTSKIVSKWLNLQRILSSFTEGLTLPTLKSRFFIHVPVIIYRVEEAGLSLSFPFLVPKLRLLWLCKFWSISWKIYILSITA